MSPELRKEQSELILHKSGIRLNLQLPVIETAEEIQLRSVVELQGRITALSYIAWFQNSSGCALRSISTIRTLAPFSNLELAYLEKLQRAEHNELDSKDDSGIDAFSTEAREALSFLLWVARVQPKLNVPIRPSFIDTRDVLNSLAAEEWPLYWETKIQSVRSRDEILNWSDLLYRLHWAVRHAHLNDKPTPGRLYVPAIEQWHKAANWICCYDEVDDWDAVSNET